MAKQKQKKPNMLPLVILFIGVVVIVCRTNPTFISRFVAKPTPIPFVLPPVHQPPEILEPDGWMHADFSEKEFVTVHFVGISNGCFEYLVITSIDTKVPYLRGCLDNAGGYTQMYAKRDYATRDPLKQIIYGVWARKANDGSNRVEVFFTKNMKR